MPATWQDDATTPSIAIIGAGSSGLAAAHILRDAGYMVTLYEQSSGVGGRATTRQRDGFIYDYGAQYIKPGDPASITLITERFRAPDLIDIAKPIWIFDSAGHIQEGDPAQNAEPKWCYRSGLITLAQRMAEGLDIRLETSIHHVEQTSTGWRLFDAAAQPAGEYRQLLITLPAPQAIDLVKASQVTSDMSETICTHLSAARYNPLISVMLGYRPRPRTRPYYALVNTDKAHPISWLAWEHEKAPERAPADSGLLIAQMAPQYSHDHRQSSEQVIYNNVGELVAALIDEPLPTPCFTAIERWSSALPATRADADALNALTLPTRLAFCGDAFVGGRVHLALEHGMAVAQKIIDTFL
jgi:renalase